MNLCEKCHVHSSFIGERGNVGVRRRGRTPWVPHPRASSSCRRGQFGAAAPGVCLPRFSRESRPRWWRSEPAACWRKGSGARRLAEKRSWSMVQWNWQAVVSFGDAVMLMPPRRSKDAPGGTSTPPQSNSNDGRGRMVFSMGDDEEVHNRHGDDGNAEERSRGQAAREAFRAYYSEVQCLCASDNEWNRVEAAFTRPLPLTIRCRDAALTQLAGEADRAAAFSLRPALPGLSNSGWVLQLARGPSAGDVRRAADAVNPASATTGDAPEATTPMPPPMPP